MDKEKCFHTPPDPLLLRYFYHVFGTLNESKDAGLLSQADLTAVNFWTTC